MSRFTSGGAVRLAWRIVAVAFVAGMALLTWHNVASTLNHPIYAQLAYGGELSPARITGGSARADLTGNTTVGVSLTHVSSQLQWLIGLQLANGSVIFTSSVLVFGVVWARTGTGAPFARIVTRALTSLAILVAVLGTLQEALDSWVNMREGYEAVGGFDNTSAYYSANGFQIGFVSLFIAFGIGVLASAFGIGARVTRERAALAKETEGLV
jgi:hypothetical protein